MMVYVDNARRPYGRMKMSHMVADTEDELLEMADRIGVARRWLQHGGTARVHFDVCLSKRAEAINQGAKPITQRELGVMVMERIKAQRMAQAGGS